MAPKKQPTGTTATYRLGWPIQEAAVKSFRSFDSRINELYVWVDEAIAEAKKTLAVDDIKLLPKTPSAKSRTRRCQRTIQANDAADFDMEILPAAKKRKKTTRASKREEKEAKTLDESSRLEAVSEEEEQETQTRNKTSGKQKLSSKRVSMAQESSTYKESMKEEMEVEEEDGNSAIKSDLKVLGTLFVDQDSQSVLNMAKAILERETRSKAKGKQAEKEKLSEAFEKPTRMKLKQSGSTASSRNSSKRSSLKFSEMSMEIEENEVMMKDYAIQVSMTSDDEVEDTPPKPRGSFKYSVKPTKENELTLNSDAVLTTSEDTTLITVTASKKKDSRITSPTVSSPSEFKSPVGFTRAVVPVVNQLRCTRSKTKAAHDVSSPAITTQATPPMSVGIPVPNTPSTAGRAKGNKIKQLQEMLCQDPSFGLRSTQATDDNKHLDTTNRRSLKRQTESENDTEGSSPKRHCIETETIRIDRTLPATSALKSSAARGSVVRTCYPVLKRIPTPNNNSVTSFVQHSAAKVLSRQEAQEIGRKNLATKVKKIETMAQRRNEEMQKKIDEQKRLQEEHHVSVQKRRQELEQSAAKKLSSRPDESFSATKSSDIERFRKSTFRESKLAEAEQRRKQQEEARRLNFQQQEREKQALEEQQRRRKEQEELERKQRIAEQRRQNEERRLRLEREQQEEQERLRKLELQRLKDEEEKRKQKEERERKERAERERLELIKQQMKEKQRQVELEKQKELMKQKIAEDQARMAGEQRSLEEQKLLQKMLEKHNQSLKQGSLAPAAAKKLSKTNLQCSVMLMKHVSPPLPSGAVDPKSVPSSNTAPPVGKTALNETFNKKVEAATSSKNVNCESYEMTPHGKKKAVSTETNYNIDDLNSEDSTDDECEPRKKIPKWAQGEELGKAIIAQFQNQQDVDKLFGKILMPDLNEIFEKKRARFNKRTSSAVWDSPMLPPKK